MNKAQQVYETNRLKELKKKNKELEETAIFIEDWEALDKIPKESDTHTLEIDVDGCNGWIHPKDDSEWDIYLSTHTFYGQTHSYSTRILRECGFNVTINNWDKK